MNDDDPLRRLLIDFFELPPDTPTDDLTQLAIGAWDSLATVQLIGELQGTFAVEFELDEIELLRSYSEIRNILTRKGVPVTP